MTPMQYIKRLVLFALIIKVTSHPTPYGSRLINFWDSGGIGSGRFGIGMGFGPANYSDDHHRHRQKNYATTGSDSSRVEISFQPLRELESVSASPSSLSSSSPFVVYPFVAEKQFLAESTNRPSPPAPNLSAAFSHNKRNFHRRRQTRTHHRAAEDNQRQRYPDEPSNDGPITAFSSSPAVNALNEIAYPEEDATEMDEPAQLPFDLQNRPPSVDGSGEQPSDEDDARVSKEEEDYPWNVFKRQQHPFSFGPTEGQTFYSSLVDDASNKRNALAAFKRQKFKSHQTQFIPSISVGAMTNLGDFFKNLKNNVEFMERGRFSGTEEQLLEGDHPISMLKEELSSDGVRPTGTAAFLHAIRTYRPSQRIRSLVALNPEGYHGSQFLDPNYMWVGLGKRK